MSEQFGDAIYSAAGGKWTQFSLWFLKFTRMGPQNGKVYTKEDELYRWQWKTVSCTFRDTDNWLSYRYKIGCTQSCAGMIVLPAYSLVVLQSLLLHMYTRVVNFNHNFPSFLTPQHLDDNLFFTSFLDFLYKSLVFPMYRNIRERTELS